MALSAAAAEDDFLVDTAGWADYYERANKQINQARAAGLADRPPEEIIDDPEAFNQWRVQCEQVYMSRCSREKY